MSSNYPSTIGSLSNPNPTDRLNSPSHSALHQSENSEIVAIETFVGTLSSVQGSLTYDIRGASSNGGGHVQTADKGGTGYTSYTKGDILIAQSTSVLTKLSIGADNQVLVANSSAATGANWGAVPGVNVQSFLASGTWNKPTAANPLSRIYVQAWGGGGGGGGGSTNQECGGGGGGGYIEGWYVSSVIASSILVSVGAGGAGGIGNIGNPGGNSVFDTQTSLLVAYSGGGGGQHTLGAAGGGGGGIFGAGGTGGSGNTNPGNGGPSGWAFASSMFASGGGGAGADIAAQSALYGAGGGGDGGNGGNSSLGGGGGGGLRASLVGIGGFSQTGGNGGNASVYTASSMLGGSVPGGGGGAGYGTAATGGAGGGGKVIVTTFL